jgi:hypothetical protein
VSIPGSGTGTAVEDPHRGGESRTPRDWYRRERVPKIPLIELCPCGLEIVRRERFIPH